MLWDSKIRHSGIVSLLSMNLQASSFLSTSSLSEDKPIRILKASYVNEGPALYVVLRFAEYNRIGYNCISQIADSSDSRCYPVRSYRGPI